MILIWWHDSSVTIVGKNVIPKKKVVKFSYSAKLDEALTCHHLIYDQEIIY